METQKKVDRQTNPDLITPSQNQTLKKKQSGIEGHEQEQQQIMKELRGNNETVGPELKDKNIPRYNPEEFDEGQKPEELEKDLLLQEKQ